MKILGISGSSRTPEQSSTYRLVRRVLDATDCETELISLAGKKIGGCIACLGCVKDNVCVVQDDMTSLREKIVEADAYVIGAPNFYAGLNALTHAFLERWYQFRHQMGDLLWGKLAVALGVGGSGGEAVIRQIETILDYSFIETIATVSGQGAACCFTCGYGQTCQVGVPQMLYGEGVQITEDMIPDIAKQPKVLAAAEKAGKLLGQRLKKHDRAVVARKMQRLMMERFKTST
ncbi:MAG: flavodoxin family protein [Sedimentisphaerales bacterium]|nr:flavodoxin family protein [Sedimentisphaerales bacterium]